MILTEKPIFNTGRLLDYLKKNSTYKEYNENPTECEVCLLYVTHRRTDRYGLYFSSYSLLNLLASEFYI